MKPISEIKKFISDNPKSSLQEFEVVPGFYSVNKRIVDLNFPKSAFIIVIERNGEYIRPGGCTVIEPRDSLMVLADNQEDFAEVNSCLSKPFLPQNP